MRSSGKNLTDLVNKRGFTHGQIAMMSKRYRNPPFSRQYITKILNGYVPPEETLEILMKILRAKVVDVRIAVEINDDGTFGEQYHV